MVRIHPKYFPGFRTAAPSILVMLFIGAIATAFANAVTLDVAPDDRSEDSERSAAPDSAKSNGLLLGLQTARDAIRAHRAKGEWKNEPITIKLTDGTYFLDEPIVFGPQDGGSPEAPITYCAAANSQPVISGGRRLKGFKELVLNDKTVWVAEIPDVKAGQWYFRQLFVNGQRCTRARMPNEGWYRFTGLPTTRPETTWGEGQQEASFKPGDLKRWNDLEDVEVVATSLWIESHLPIVEVDEAKHTVKFDRKSVFRLTNGHTPGDFSRYYVENVFEGMDSPGEWYLNRKTGTLYYVPRPGEELKTAKVIAARLPLLMQVGAKSDPSPVTDLHFKGLRFEHVDWSLPADLAGSRQAAVDVPGAVVLGNASRCTFHDCSASHVSTYGIELTAGCQENTIENCVLTDLGAGGIKIGHDTSKTSVTNCEIGPGGLIYHSAVGVWIGNSGDNTVTHNHIHDFYYTGVSVGWSWGYGDSKAVRNMIEFNHIHDIGKGMLADMGGIYTLGVSPGTTLRYNRIHDVDAYNIGWGIYNDEGSTGILIENNIVYRTSHGGYHQHYGRENIIRNNVFAFGTSGQIIRSLEEDHLSFTFERNIVYFSEGPLLGSTWKNGHYKLDSNCYWRTGGGSIDFAGMTFEQWRQKGFDTHSIIADPMFADAEHGDFSLKPDSPALKIGFKPIDTGQIGRRRD